MSITSSFTAALDFLPSYRSRFAPGRLLGSARLFLSAMSEGLAAAEQYRALTARGVPHDDAIKVVFADQYANQ